MIDELRETGKVSDIVYTDKDKDLQPNAEDDRMNDNQMQLEQ
jgi:hypothetical protein